MGLYCNHAKDVGAASGEYSHGVFKYAKDVGAAVGAGLVPARKGAGVGSVTYCLSVNISKNYKSKTYAGRSTPPGPLAGRHKTCPYRGGVSYSACETSCTEELYGGANFFNFQFYIVLLVWKCCGARGCGRFGS